ncbi:DUF58 domain-containing protein [Kurthia massiliensis]|uniref:DUF58 domain-containing protein n=1 Tax=Kurthia massiliensis TaxID=1033739 RepID=UPI0005C8480E|nr:DUF58 domain-containing protein [Kurthia massiliensis]
MKSRYIRLSTSALGRLLLVVLLLAVAFGFALIQGGFVSWFIFYMLLPPLVYSCLLWFMPIGQFNVMRETQNKRLTQHDTLTMTVTLTRKSRFPLLYVIVEEVLPKGVFDTVEQRETRRLVAVGFRKQITWTYDIEDVPRGEHQLVGIYVTMSDFFGWVQKTKFIEAKRTVIVFPTVQPLVYKKPLRHKTPGTTTALQSRLRDTNVVSGIRDYEAGDRMSWIHWKSFAKTGKLQTKEFEPYRDDCTMLVLDTLPSPMFEAQVSFAASVLTSAQKQRESINYMTAAARPYVSDNIQTEAQLQKMMVHLANVQQQPYDVTRIYAHDESLRQAALIYFITSIVTTEWVEVLCAQTSPKNCLLFVIVDPTIRHEATAAETLAASRGMRVLYVPADHFAHAFEEGGVR